jgi:leucyl aminopeptidase
VTTYTLSKGSADKTRADLVVVGVARDKRGKLVVCPGGEAVAAAYGRSFAPLLTSLGFTGKSGETARLPTNKTVQAAQLLVVGLGPREELSTEKVRRAAGVAARNATNASSVALALPAVDAEHVRALTEGFISGQYSFDDYKTGKKQPGISDAIVLCEAARRKDVMEAFDNAQLLAGAITRARDWVNTPPNDLTPEAFAAQIQQAFRRRKGVTVEVLDHERLAELGCGGILGVGMGSANRPCLVKVAWEPEDAAGHVALVGKGITYDSGGLTIKPGASMTHMKSDMAGAAAVVASVEAIAARRLPVAVTAWVPLAENSVSGTAMRPGDVLTTYSGKTVEIRNTDAEGRLVLCDALAMAAEAEPDRIVELSTLTGPCVVALGNKIAGLFGDDDTVAAVEAAASSTGELFWHLPIPEESRTAVTTESKVADLLQHNWVRWGSALFAAAFLEQFVDGLPWTHWDIAGPAWNPGGAWGHVPSGGTGFGIATVVELVESLTRA